jgi:hypothetical protein
MEGQKRNSTRFKTDEAGIAQAYHLLARALVGAPWEGVVGSTETPIEYGIHLRKEFVAAVDAKSCNKNLNTCIRVIQIIKN